MTAVAEAQLPYRCQSYQCREAMEDSADVGRILFLPEGSACPDCQSKKYLYPLAVIHLLVRCEESDPNALRGRNGTWKVVCGETVKKAKRLATERDVMDGDGFLKSPIVTCHRCRELTKDKQPPEREGLQI